MKQEKRKKSAVREMMGWLLYMAILVAAAFLLVHFVGERTVVSGDSMSPTLSDGDNLIVDKLSYRVRAPKRFEIVVFPFQYQKGTYYIKRIIGLPGEQVQIYNGKVYINDSEIPLDDSFVPEKPRGSFGPYEVPENSYFVLGDNRNHSKDSRCWKSTSFVTFDEIVGKAVIRYYPSVKLLK